MCYVDDMFFLVNIFNNYIESERFIGFVLEFLLSYGFELNKWKSIFKKYILFFNGYVIEGVRSDFLLGDICLLYKKLKLLDKLFYEFGKGKSNVEILKYVFGLDVDKVNFLLLNME